MFSKHSVKNNVIEKEQFMIEGRKRTLLEISQKLLAKHSRFMQLNNDEYFDSLDKKTLEQRLIKDNQFKNEISVEEMKTNLKSMKGHVIFKYGHDGSTFVHHVISCFLSMSPMRLDFRLMLNIKLYHA